MIDKLDTVLDYLLKSQVTQLQDGGLVLDGQVGFQPPDEHWRGHINGLGSLLALNAYLLDLRENRKLRTNERIRTYQNGSAHDEAAPARVDCHYLITAWSPAVNEADRVTLEHKLLAQTMAVLMHNQPLSPRRIYDPYALPAGIIDTELPCHVLPPEGFPKLAEFWGTMGIQHRWKPAIYLVVTVPVLSEPMIAGPMVTTVIVGDHLRDRPDARAGWMEIAGTVRDGSQQPVVAAWVRLETPAGAPLQPPLATDENGRFIFSGLTAGPYRLHVVGFGLDQANLINVPSQNGGYDILFV